MSWALEHVKWVVNSIWRRNHSENFTFTGKGNLHDLAEKWLEEVRKDLGKVFNSYFPSEFDLAFPVIHNSILSAWSQCKGTLILPGRDVWPWYVMAKRMGIPTHHVGIDHPPREKRYVLFDPRISRNVTKTHSFFSIVNSYGEGSWPRIESPFVFDTGFEGTIPKAIFKTLQISGSSASRQMLQQSEFLLLPSVMLSANSWCGIPSVYPNLKENRRLALTIELWPKYWTSGESGDEYYSKSEGGASSFAHGPLFEEYILQTENSIEEMVRALKLTLLLSTYNYSFKRRQRPKMKDIRLPSPNW